MANTEQRLARRPGRSYSGTGLFGLVTSAWEAAAAQHWRKQNARHRERSSAPQHILLQSDAMGRAQDEMVEGYMDGRDPDNPEPSDNRSRAYRHGFQSGRDDFAVKPSALAQVRRKQADEILAEDSE